MSDFKIFKYSSFAEQIWFLLRLGILLCFVGHGFWGLMQKEGWLIFFKIFSISDQIAFRLMPIIGICDILLGLMIFIKPRPILLLWASFWTVFTALLRPMAGMGFSEFFERAGNFAVPIACLYLIFQTKQPLRWWQSIKVTNQMVSSGLKGLEQILKLGLVSLLAGHGGLILFSNNTTVVRNLGLLFPKVEHMTFFGYFEILLALAVLIIPRLTGLMVFVCIFKLLTELLFPFVGSPIEIFETIERGGDYVIPAILLIIYTYQYSLKIKPEKTGVAQNI